MEHKWDRAEQDQGSKVHPTLEREGVLWQGDKIAVWPRFRCAERGNNAALECEAALDRLELRLQQLGFWVLGRHKLWPAGLGEVDPLARARELGADAILVVDRHEVSRPKPLQSRVVALRFASQEVAQKRRDLPIKRKDWPPLRRRCLELFEGLHQTTVRPGVARLDVRLLSLDQGRVLWAQQYQEQEPAPPAEITRYHPFPRADDKRELDQKISAGLAIGAFALGAGAGTAWALTRTRQPGMGAGMGVVALVSVGASMIAALRWWSLRPRLPEAQEVLCHPRYARKEASLVDPPEQSASFLISPSPAAAGGDKNHKLAQRRAGLVAAVQERFLGSLSKMHKKAWAKPKPAKKDKIGKYELVCRWEKQSLRCRSLCMLCEDPFEGPCAPCAVEQEGPAGASPEALELLDLPDVTDGQTKADNLDRVDAPDKP